LGAILVSCGSARTIIYDPVVIPDTMISMNQVEIFNRSNTVFVPEEVQALFEKKLKKSLYCDGRIQCGPGVSLEYRFIQFNPGNRFSRYMLGGIGNTGEASLQIEVTYVGSDGSEFGKVQTEGKINSGLFGGSSDNAVERAAEEVGNYTRSMLLR
jgi:hypothetical protein